MKLKFKRVQPKTGEIHRLFGVNYLKLHQIREPKWLANDKLGQYYALTNLHGFFLNKFKNNSLNYLKKSISQKRIRNSTI